MNIFELVATLTLDKSDFDDGIDDSEKKTKSFGDKLKNAMKVGAKGVAAVGASMLAVGGAVTKLTGDLAEYGDHIDKMSQKMGISAEAYQEWDAIMQHSGTSIDTMSASMKTMSAAAEKGSDAFQKLGISQEEVANLSKEDLFAKVIEGLQGMEEGTERTYLASQLLGRGSTELGALLNMSAEETEAMRQRVHELGGVMSDEAVKASAQYQDSLQDMKTAFTGLKNNIISQFLPSFTKVMDGITDIFAGDKGKGIATVKEGLSAIGTTIRESVPVIAERMGEVVSALLEMLVEALPDFLDMGLNIIEKMISGIGSNMPKIINKILEVATKLLSTLAQRLPQFLEMGVKLIIQMISGLLQAAPQILSALGKIGAEMISALTKIDWLGLGSQIVNGIANGIRNFGGAIWNSLKSVVSDAWGKVKSFLGISSPSKLMADTIGKYIPSGIAVGIEANADEVKDAMEYLAQIPMDVYKPQDYSFETAGTETTNYGGVTINVYAQDQDPKEIAEEVMDIMENTMVRRGLVNA